MPLKTFQENYWVNASTVAAPPTPAGRGGYPGWQASVVASLFGALWELAVSYWGRLQWWWNTLQRLWAMDPEQVTATLDTVGQPEPPPIVQIVHVPVITKAPERKKAPRTRVGGLVRLAKRVARLPDAQQVVVTRALDLLEAPQFGLAQTAVQQTATTLGFQRPESWRSLSHLLKADQGRAENMYRHVKAVEMVRDLARAQGSTLTNPAANLLVELAYHEYTVTGRR
jgi:hypothetical protein